MACLNNYVTQCVDVTTGETGCFFFDTSHWQITGEFKAVGEVYPGLIEFFNATPRNDRKPIYLERL
jgi:hypothetical protein